MSAAREVKARSARRRANTKRPTRDIGRSSAREEAV